jgi:hypothetical protein
MGAHEVPEWEYAAGVLARNPICSGCGRRYAEHIPQVDHDWARKCPLREPTIVIVSHPRPSTAWFQEG